jgi:hypothetical protein
MAYENSGTLSRNDKKTEPNHADHRGDANTVCPACGAKTEWWLNAWVKTTKDGARKFFSISLKPKEGQKPQAPPPPKQEEGDDVPF